MKQNNQGCLRDPIWQFISVIIAILSLFLAIFVWFVPNKNTLFTTNTPPTPTSTISKTQIPTSTNLPAFTPTSATQSLPSSESSPSTIELDLEGWWATLIAACFIALLLSYIPPKDIIVDLFIAILSSFTIECITALLFPSTYAWSVIMGWLGAIISIIIYKFYKFIDRKRNTRTL